MHVIRQSYSHGFSLLEAIVALLLVTMLGMATFSWISNLLISIEKIEKQSVNNLIKRNVNEYLSDINVMRQPSGEEEISGVTIAWRAELVEPIKKGLNSNGGQSQFELGLYRVSVDVSRDTEQIMAFSTMQVGHNSVPYDVF
ncbi:PulJ/GspJ family protein [Alteromonas sp. S015]|uniref:PulJ/GspJ family protein n=1 Tax=Alteromonas sp. S015 TaxID=3117401 RepID=UPI002FDF645A